jgi:hypothetical protein
MLNCLLMRRLLLMGLTLSLIELGPVPLSACAFLSSKAAECSTPRTESRCNEMNLGDTVAKLLAAPNASCCDLSRAPVPESQQNASKTSLAVTTLVVPEVAWIAPPIRRDRLSYAAPDMSPALLQSFLCTFLI